jgi:DNA polymerase-3 subunit epsilon
MNSTFTAIDFETAQGYRHTICAVGLVRVIEGKIVQTLELLVQPPDNYYWDWFSSDIHGITAEDTKNSPSFDKVWPQIEPFISNQTVVAHNGFGFDFQCLKKTLEYYGVEVPEYEKQCTYKIYGNNLVELCKEHNIKLNHHNALSDAMACAELYLKHILNNN